MDFCFFFWLDGLIEGFGWIISLGKEMHGWRIE